jgi:hypothetical protein
VSTHTVIRTQKEALKEVERIRKKGGWAEIKCNEYHGADAYEMRSLTRNQIEEHLKESERIKSKENFASDEEVRSFIKRYRRAHIIGSLPPYIQHRVKSKYIDGPKGGVEAEAERIRKEGGWAIVQESGGITVTGYPDIMGWRVTYLDKACLRKYIKTKPSKKA